jgi:WD40 repeat protein
MIELTGHSGLVVALAYSPDGRTLASASADGTARLWDLAKGKLTATLQSPAARAHCVAFAPDGQSLAVGYGGPNGLVQLWDLDPLRRRESWAAHDYNTRAVTFSFDGRRLLTGGNQPSIRQWVLEGLNRTTIVTGDGSPTSAVAYEPDGFNFAALPAHGRYVALYAVVDGKTRMRQRREIPLTSWSDGNCVAFSPDGRELVCGLESAVASFDLSSMRSPPTIWPAHAGAVLGVAFTPDGQTLLTGGADGLVKLWDPAGRLRHVFDWKVGEVGAVAFAPDGLTAAAGGYETILVWDVTG